MDLNNYLITQHSVRSETKMSLEYTLLTVNKDFGESSSDSRLYSPVTSEADGDNHTQPILSKVPNSYSKVAKYNATFRKQRCQKQFQSPPQRRKTWEVTLPSYLTTKYS